MVPRHGPRAERHPHPGPSARVGGSHALMLAVMRCPQPAVRLRTAGPTAVLSVNSTRSVASSLRFMRFGVGPLRLST